MPKVIAYTCTSFSSASDELTDLTSGARTLPFPAHVQCYWRSPKVLKYFMEFAIFAFLGLSGSFITKYVSCKLYCICSYFTCKIMLPWL